MGENRANPNMDSNWQSTFEFRLSRDGFGIGEEQGVLGIMDQQD